MIGNATRVLAFGYYGAGNAGDEMLLEALAAGVRANGGSLEAISLDADYTSRRHGIQATDFQDYPGIVRALERSDLFVLGGGGLLQSHYPFSRTALFSFFHMDISAYVRPLLVARQMGVRTLAWAQGIGPLNNPQARDLAAEVVQLIDDRSVRDQASLDLLRSAGVEGDILVAPDPVWAMQLPEARLGAVRGQQRIGIVIRPWSFDEAWKDQLVAAIEKSLDREMELVWIPFQAHQIPNRSGSDWPLVEELIARLPDWRHVRSEARTTQEIVSAFAECDGVIAMRYHAQIIGARLGKPVVGIEYDDKMSANAEEIGFAADSRVKLSDEEEAWSRAMEWLKRAMRQGSDRLILEKARLVGKQAQAHNNLLATSMKKASSSGHNAQPLHEMDWLSHWEIEQLQAQLNARDYQISQMASGLTVQTELQETLKGNAGVLSESLRLLQAELDENRILLAQRSAESDALTRKMENLAAEHGTLSELKDCQLSELHESAKAVARLSAEADELRREVENAAAEHKALSELKDRQLSEQEELFRRRIETKEREHADLAAGLLGQINGLKQAQIDLERSTRDALRALEDRLRASGESEERLRIEIAALLQQRSDSEMEKEVMQANMSDANAKLENARQELAGKDGELATCRQLIDDLRVKMAELNDWAYEQKQHADRLLQEVHDLRNSTSWKMTRPLRFVRYFARSPGHALGEAWKRIAKSAPASVARAESADCVRKVETQARTIYIFTGVPYDDIGGGQRAAQLARVLLTRGEHVKYVYAYQKWHDGAIVESNVVIDHFDHVFLDRISIDEMLSGAGSEDVAIFELPHPRFKDALDKCKGMGVSTVFELIDAWDSSLGGDWFNDEVFNHFIAAPDKVVGTAKVLRDILVRKGRVDALYLPNAANEAIFDSYRHYERPHDMDVGKRAALYFGSLYGEWFDWESLDAAARYSPDTVFYLIGDPPVGRSVASNIRFLGAKDITELPAYLRYSDVAILPFKPGHISDAVSPIKVFEYIYMGVPVVANDLPEIHGYPNVSIASSPGDFAQLCANPERKNEDVDGFVMTNSWASRADAITRARVSGRNVSAIVLMHNNRSIIGRCIRSLGLHGGEHLAEIIVVDNCSTDGGAEYVEREFPGVRLVRNAKNGCSSGRNLGTSVSKGEYLAFFDSDQWLTSRGAFEEALLILQSRPDIGAVGWAAGWFATGNKDFGGPIVDYMPSRGTLTEEYRRDGLRTDIAYLGSGGLFLRRKLFDEIGGFDEKYDPTCFEDTDFTLGVKKAGKLIAYRDLQGIRHQAHQTTGASGGSSEYQKLFRRNANYFGAKWKEYPQFFFDA